MLKNEPLTNLYSLSATEELSGHRIDVYTDTLKRAIKDPDINNIAITGDTGIGKSSVIRSYLKDSTHRFASLSLAEYTVEYQNTANSNGSAAENSKQRLEKSMLRQILSLCRKRDIPSSAMELIPENRFRHKVLLMGLAVAAYVLMWMTELNSKRISNYIHTVFQYSGALTVWRLALDILLAASTFLLIAILIYKIVSHMRVKEVSADLGNDNVKVSATAAAIQTFSLEKYRMELTYVFERISKRYTAIVFEDMDRIDDRIAIEILTYLREINTSVNERLRNGYRRPGKIRRNISGLFGKLMHKIFSERFLKTCKTGYYRAFKRKLCFIYVINEDMVSKFDYHKYIDFGLSIIPTLSQSNAMDSTDLLLKDLPGFIGIKIFDDPIYRDYKKLLDKLFADVPSLCDFRKIYQIKNDYGIFHDALLYSNNPTAQLLPDCNERTLLSFMIYKNLLPGDYSRIRLGKSYVFQISLPTKDKKGNQINVEESKINKIIIDFLINTIRKTPPPESPKPDRVAPLPYLSFIGFSEKAKRDECEEMLTAKKGYVSAEEKSDFFNKDILDERLTIKIFRNTADQPQQREICYKIEDIFLKYLVNEYVEARNRSFKGNTLEIKQAKANIEYFVELIKSHKRNAPPVSDRDVLNKNRNELNAFLEKRKIRHKIRKIRTFVKEYFTVMESQNR